MIQFIARRQRFGRHHHRRRHNHNIIGGRNVGFVVYVLQRIYMILKSPFGMTLFSIFAFTLAILIRVGLQIQNQHDLDKSNAQSMFEHQVYRAKQIVDLKTQEYPTQLIKNAVDENENNQHYLLSPTNGYYRFRSKIVYGKKNKRQKQRIRQHHRHYQHYRSHNISHDVSHDIWQDKMLLQFTKNTQGNGWKIYNNGQENKVLEKYYIDDGFVAYDGTAYWILMNEKPSSKVKTIIQGKFAFETNNFIGSWKQNNIQEGSGTFDVFELI